MSNNLFERSQKSAQRRDFYQSHTGNLLSSQPQQWEETQNDLVNLFSVPRNMGIIALVDALGVFFLIGGIFFGGGSRLVGMALFFLIIGAIPTAFIFKRVMRQDQRNDRIFNWQMSLEEMTARARLAIHEQFTAADIQLASIEAGVTAKELELALVASMVDNNSRNHVYDQQVMIAGDVRAKDHELSMMDKQQLLAEAVGRIERDTYSTKAEATREEIRLRNELDIANAKANILIQKQSFELEMTKLDKVHTQEQRQQTLREVTELRKVLVASAHELRNNPALADKINSIIESTKLLETLLAKKEYNTEEGLRLKESMDVIVNQLILKEVGLGGETSGFDA